MKTFRFLSLLFGACLLTACEKPDETDPPIENPLGDKPPCYGSFKCTINGEPFQSYGTGGGCSPRSISYNLVTKYLHIAGIDCRANSTGNFAVVFESNDVLDIGTYSTDSVNCAIFDQTGILYHYNDEISGQVTIKKITLPPYSDDFPGGYIEGTFWFTSYCEELNDTVDVTDGEFCGTF